ncbi:hypothetical protein AtNW77_Chr2g0239691 [Arabidopsis thaliana]|uniref:Uncharacterized protein n=2 Tax=Arabidopsis TaxID=3701 RepID=A0A178VXJ5_ARATH|nr:hypothetical protein ISN45_At02g015240 [Arabidopsis thaliana x Arabidopsis arenosa]OAP11077.1 hypothetical protein AXX17_AT2G16950 [Arabidopsis thaliana]
MDANQQNPQKKAWPPNPLCKSITQGDLAKRLDPFYLPNLFDGFEDSKYGLLVDDVVRLCKLKRDYSSGYISLADIEAREEKKPAKSANIIISEPTKSTNIIISEPAKSADIIIIDSDDVLPQESVIPPDDKRSKKLKEVIVVDDDEPWFYANDKLTIGSASTSNAVRNSSYDVVMYGNSSGCLQEGCVGEGSSRNSIDNDNQTPLYVEAKK